jgi:hypothetical protein
MPAFLPEDSPMRQTFLVRSVFVLCLAGLPAAAALAQEVAPDPVDPEAMAILQGAAKQLADAPSFSVSLRAAYDTVQESGQKIEFNEVRKVLVQRPAKLRVDIEESNGDRSLVLFDGKELVSYDQSHNVYAKAPVEGDIDAAIRHFVGELRMRLPLAMLMVTQLPAELESRVQALEYVEETKIFGVTCDHLAARTGTGVDFQVWIAQGEKPLIHRIVLTYRDEPGAPEFRAQFSDWNFAPKGADAQFAFSPPSGATRIQFLAHVAQAPAAPATTGEQP